MVQLEPIQLFWMEACWERVVLGAIRVSLEIVTRVVGGGIEVGWIFVGWDRIVGGGSGFLGSCSVSWAESLARRSEVRRRSGVVSILRRRGAVGVDGRM